MKQHIIFYNSDNEITGNHTTVKDLFIDEPTDENHIVFKNYTLYADNIRNIDDLEMIKSILKIWKTPLHNSTIIPEMINEYDIIKEYVSKP